MSLAGLDVIIGASSSNQAVYEPYEVAISKGGQTTILPMAPYATSEAKRVARVVVRGGTWRAGNGFNLGTDDNHPGQPTHTFRYSFAFIGPTKVEVTLGDGTKFVYDNPGSVTFGSGPRTRGPVDYTMQMTRSRTPTMLNQPGGTSSAMRSSLNRLKDEDPEDPEPVPARVLRTRRGWRMLGDDMDDAIDELLGATTTPQVMNYVDKPTVLAVQTSLKAKGFKLKPVSGYPDGCDGVFGSDTAKAIRLYQAAVNLSPTGVIDYALLTALRIPVPSIATRTEAGSSVSSAAAQDVANVANNAAGEAAKAGTGATLLDAAKVVEAASTAAPPAPPAVQAAAKAAARQAAAAKTAEEVKAASAAVQSAGMAVVQAATPGWWVQPTWAGAPIKRWHAIAGAGVTVVLSSVLLAVLRRK